MNTRHFNLKRVNSDTRQNSENAGRHGSTWETPEGDFEGLMPVPGEERSLTHERDAITATQATRSGHPVNSDSETLTPVSLKQIRDAIALGIEPVMINNTVTKHVTAVARVIRVDAQLTRVSLLLDDCTAVIEAVYLTTPDSGISPDDYTLQRYRSVTETLWIRVVGVLCLMEGETKISIFRMRPVHDLNEVLFHRLDVIKTFLEQTRNDNHPSVVVKHN